jgi:hypothetical protein
MGLVASFMFRTWAFLMGAKAIRLIGVPRPGGYVFVTSPDLPGFSVMLRPGEHEDATSVFAVLSEPLKAFLSAECHASLRAEKRVRVTAVRQTAPDSYLAELCTA